MKTPVKWSIIIPAILAIYLAVMVVMGWDSYQAGMTSGVLYFGGTAITILCIILLHFHLKRTEGRKKLSVKSKEDGKTSE